MIMMETTGRGAHILWVYKESVMPNFHSIQNEEFVFIIIAPAALKKAIATDKNHSVISTRRSKGNNFNLKKQNTITSD
ncbi:hypothetical protein COCNU_scaffold001487G000050 [Cocos nucifera]|nr:hypothetical protein [Cocos nucifera]